MARSFTSLVSGSVMFVALMVTIAAVPAEAQRISESRIAATPDALPFDATSAQQQAADRKEPALAGVLSWVIPGVGSFYAGNSRHGAIHLGIHVVSFAVYVGGLASAVEECTYDFSSGSEDCTGGSFAVAGVGLLALLTNDIWSIFTAVGDARAYNAKSGGARPGRVVGELYLAPEVRSVRDIQVSPVSTETDRRVGMQLMKLQF